MSETTTSDYHFQDEHATFISPKGEEFGLGIARAHEGVHVGLTDDEGDGAAVVLTAQQAAAAGRALLRLSGGPVYESAEELAAEVVRLREESARAYSQGVEDMREKAASTVASYGPTPMLTTIARHIRALGDEPDTSGVAGDGVLTIAEAKAALHMQDAPRDSDLIQQVRSLVKRYGAPAIAAEAARQAQHH